MSIFRLRWGAPWLDAAFRVSVAGQDAGRALGGAQDKAEAYAECLERQSGLAAPEIMRACAREVDMGRGSTLMNADF